LKTLLLQRILSLGIGIGLLSGCFSTKMMEFTYQQLDSVKTTQAELLERFDSLSAELAREREARLIARAEAMTRLDEFREILDVLSYRIEDSAQLLQSLNPSYRLPARSAVKPPVARPDSSRQAVHSGDSLQTSVPDSLVVEPPGPDDGAPERLFKSSYMDLTLGNHDLAIQGFKNYLARFPDGANLPDAYYYLGESYYRSARYLEAVSEFQVVLREFPNSRFVPAAYLKSGYCYRELEERELAEKAFRDLIARHPHTEEAEQARVALQDMGG
jgi:tol-pal system protein YbgF